MEAHQERVVAEADQLNERTNKLGAFLLSDLYKTLPEVEQKRLARQHTVMTQYLQVLNERIADF